LIKSDGYLIISSRGGGERQGCEKEEENEGVDVVKNISEEYVLRTTVLVTKYN